MFNLNPKNIGSVLIILVIATLISSALMYLAGYEILSAQVERSVRAGDKQPGRGEIAELRQELQAANRRNLEQIARLRTELLTSDMATNVERILDGATTDAEKTMRLALWVSSNIRNDRASDYGRDPLAWFSNRVGRCGAKTRMFVEMLKFANIPAGVFNIYNFNRNFGAHSVAQVYYDGAWHMFDVTYAGVFMRGDHVMSWEEIKQDPETAHENMVVFQKTIDRYISENREGGRRVNNNERMKQVYTVDYIRNARTYGFWRGDDMKVLFPQVDLSEHPDGLVLGEIDGAFADVTSDGREMGISGEMGRSLGTHRDTFSLEWEFINPTPDRLYRLNIHSYRASQGDLKFWAKSDTAVIERGAEFETTESKTTERLWKSSPATWSVDFRCGDTGGCRLAMGYDFRGPNRGLFIDKIEILPAAR